MQRSKKRFIYTHTIIISIASLLFIVFIMPFLFWFLNPARPLKVFVIDKTTGSDYREHRSLFWLLKHWKYVQPGTNNFYDERKDYYGYFPEDTVFSSVSQLQLHQTDLLYLTDTYGVYGYPMEYDRYERLLPEVYIPTALKYGGLTGVEMDEIERYDSFGRMAIAEFNTLEDPQLEDRTNQRRLEQMFGVRYTGALGRYYDNLNTAARWMKDMYELQYRMPWDFSGRGLIISITRDTSDTRPGVVILESKDLAHTPIFLRNSGHRFLSKTEDEVPYYFFFEFLDVDSSASVIARFEIHCETSGSEKMLAAGLPQTFPAVVVSGASDRKLYFAGDFADNNVETMLTEYWNAELLLSKLFSFYFVSDQTRFFWKFYLPMMDRIFQQASEQQQHSH
ncbi:MAG: hypothetical protein WCW35_06025 [Bacteroidota bacterium]|jgi:hypothetical protein